MSAQKAATSAPVGATVGAPPHTERREPGVRNRDTRAVKKIISKQINTKLTTVAEGAEAATKSL
jgi:hypothetical protein